MSNRVCFYTNEGFYSRVQGGYIVAKVTENEPGYVEAGIIKTIEKCKDICDNLNNNLGVSKDDVLDIVGSSMFAGPVR